jgi:hypothetical protein
MGNEQAGPGEETGGPEAGVRKDWFGGSACLPLMANCGEFGQRTLNPRADRAVGIWNGSTR